MTQWKTLVERGDYRELKRLLAQEDLKPLRVSWGKLEPMQKAILFKLMEPNVAMGFYVGLSFDDKYFLFSAFDPGAIAPLTEKLEPRLRALFHRLSEECYEEMLRDLKA